MMPMPGYTSAAMDPRKPTPASRTVRSQSLGKVFPALLGHGLDAGCVWGLLRYAQDHGDGETALARVAFDGATWTANLFGPRREAA